MQRAHSLIGFYLTVRQAAGDMASQHCSAALARSAEIQQSGGPDAASELPDQLARLCASLTGHHPADRLPPPVSHTRHGAADRWPRHPLDIAAALPAVDGIVAQLDSLFSWPGSWEVYLRARPGWWAYSEDQRRRWPPVSVHAEDDLSGMYLNVFGGSTGHSGYSGGHEELALRSCLGSTRSRVPKADLPRDKTRGRR